jgi:hypothetical protein
MDDNIVNINYNHYNQLRQGMIDLSRHLITKHLVTFKA